MWIVQYLPYGPEELGRPFQIALNASITSAAERMLVDPLPPLYLTSIEYMPEPWSGTGVEEFADPWTTFGRGWGDCDDLVIYRAAELVANGLPAHARVLRLGTRYHTQVARDFDGLKEDPSLERLGKDISKWLFR